MMSLESIKELSAEASRKASANNDVPLMVETDDLDNLRNHLRYMPFLGDYVPKNYEKVNEYFVDSSGFGEPWEPALTQEQFLAKVKPGMAYAVTESGQFQLYVGEYKYKNNNKEVAAWL